MFAALIDGLTGSSIDELDTALAAAKARRDAADLEIAAVAAIVDARQLFHDAGHHSTNGYLKGRLNCSPAEARKIRGRARLCNLHPQIGDLLGASRIGVGQVDLLADVARHPSRANQTEFQRDCAARRDLHGDDALAHPLPRSAEQRGFDAIHAIFMHSTTAPGGGTRPEPLVNIIIDSTTALDVLARHGLLDLHHTDNISNGNNDSNIVADTVIDPSRRRCATSTGVPIHPDEALTAMIRGSIRRVIVDAHDVVINMGRTQRLFTGKARHAAQLLTVRCGYRGCDVPAQFCDIDHINEWSADGGDTNQANALPLCGTHDRWKHRQRLRGRRDRTGRIHLIKPDGTVIKPLGATDPTWADSEPDQCRIPAAERVTAPTDQDNASNTESFRAHVNAAHCGPRASREAETGVRVASGP